MEFLSLEKLSVLLSIKDKFGDMLVRKKGIYILLFPYIEELKVNLLPSMVSHISGKMLGLMHRASFGYKRYSILRNFDISQYHYLLMSNIFKARKRRINKSYLNKFLNLVNQCENIIKIVLSSMASIELEKTGICWIHGDFHRENLLWKGTTTPYIIDFDSAQILPRLCELRQSISRFCQKIDEINNLDSDLVKNFLSSYFAHAPPLSPLEKKYSSTLMKYSVVHEIQWELANLKFDNEDDLCYFNQRLNLIDTIELFSDNL